MSLLGERALHRPAARRHITPVQAQADSRPLPAAQPHVPWLTMLAWAGLGLYLGVVALLWLPSVHYYFDAVAIRDTGTLWASLTWDLADKRHFLPAAILWHPEGPLQFLFLNAYYALVGNWFPLNPLTTQVPNVLFASLGAFVVFRLGEKLHSRRLGYVAALCFIFMPWLGPTLRLPWVFNTLTCLLQATTLYGYTGYVLQPQRRLYRVAAPVSLALYLCTGLDWPLFLPMLGLFLALNGRLFSVLRNRYNVLPLGVLALYAVWTVALYLYGRGEPGRADLYRQSLLMYPFLKMSSRVTMAPVLVAKFVWQSFGPAIVLGVFGVLFVRWRTVFRSERVNDPLVLSDRLLVTMVVWMFLGLGPLMIHTHSVTWAYVLGIPVAFLAGWMLVRLRTAVVIAMFCVMIGMQLRTGLWKSYVTRRDLGDDRRVLAVAAFLNEDRPDLLKRERTALLPRSVPSNVGQYARGQNVRLIMPEEFPYERFVHSIASDPTVLLDLVNTYERTGEFKADWVILSSENLSPLQNRASAFYQRLLQDPQLSWIGCFKDEHGRMLWLGEVVRKGDRRKVRKAEEAPIYSVQPLANLYERRYDRIRFLSQNATWVSHY